MQKHLFSLSQKPHSPYILHCLQKTTRQLYKKRTAYLTTRTRKKEMQILKILASARKFHDKEGTQTRKQLEEETKRLSFRSIAHGPARLSKGIRDQISFFAHHVRDLGERHFGLHQTPPHISHAWIQNIEKVYNKKIFFNMDKIIMTDHTKRLFLHIPSGKYTVKTFAKLLLSSDEWFQYIAPLLLYELSLKTGKNTWKEEDITAMLESIASENEDLHHIPCQILRGFLHEGLLSLTFKNA